MSILVTGGLGFIGSNTVVELLKEENDVVVVDNLSNCSIEVIDKIKLITGKEIKFYKEDVQNYSEMKKIFENHNFEAVIHFAGYKAVGESVQKPLMYYENNLMSTIRISELCIEHDVKKLIFSSSATVYGDNKSPMVETMDLLPTTNPYGETKAMCERILKDTAKVNENFVVTILRYFNPIGGHESGLLCEKPNGIPNNLMPYIVQVAEGKREQLSVYGNDYDTIDGTGVRDYIHVVDLARGHVLALKNNEKGASVYNLGTGNGISVLQLVNKFAEVNKVEVPYVITERRPGDIATCFADCTKAERELGFRAKFGVTEMCRDSIGK